VGTAPQGIEVASLFTNKEKTMSVSSVWSNNPLSQTSDSRSGQRHSDFRQLVSALQSGNLTAAQQAFSQLQSDLGTSDGGAASGTISSGNRFQNLLSQIGSALQGGDLSGAQQALASFQSQGSQANSGAGGASEGAGALLDAIFQALSHAGVSTTAATDSSSSATGSATTSTASGENPLQALAEFMHNLFTALQSQGGQATQDAQTSAQGTANSDGGSDNTGNPSVSGAPGGHHHHHGGDLGQIESKLQGLIQQQSSSTSSTSIAGTTATSGSSTTNSALQQSYQDLLSSLGVSGSASTLGTFLQALSLNLQGLGSSGNVVNTQT
jgi:hypothetical protein